MAMILNVYRPKRRSMMAKGCCISKIMPRLPKLRGKKGIFFTLISITIIVLLFVWSGNRHKISTIDKLPVAKDRITRMNDLMLNINTVYLQQMLETASYSGLNAIADYERQQMRFLTKPELDCALMTVPAFGIMLNNSLSMIAGSDAYFTTNPRASLALEPSPVNSIAFGRNYVAVQSFIATNSTALTSANFSFLAPIMSLIKVELRSMDCGTVGHIMATGNTTIGAVDWVSTQINFTPSTYLRNGRTYYFAFYAPHAADNGASLRLADADYPGGFLYKQDSPTLSFRIDEKLGATYLGDNYIQSKLDQLSSSARSIYFLDARFEIYNLTISQSDPEGSWKVRPRLNLGYYINSSVAAWDVNKTVESAISIIGLPDPYVYVQTQGLHSNNITDAFENLTTDYLTIRQAWNYGNFTKHLQYRTFKREQKAPSYLMRLYNNTNSSNCCGIESLIHFGDYPVNMSYIDYCFWSSVCPGSVPRGNVSLYNVTGITTPIFRFLIDFYHGVQYNITDYLVFATNESSGHG